jgi:hypothetical protein
MHAYSQKLAADPLLFWFDAGRPPHFVRTSMLSFVFSMLDKLGLRSYHPRTTLSPLACSPLPGLPTCEHVAAGAHGPANEHRLACELIVNGDEGVVGRKCACGALAVHQQRHQAPIHHVLLDLHRVAAAQA